MIDHRKIEDAIDSYFKNTPTAKIIENLDRLSADREKDLARENINRKTANNRDSVIGNLVRFEEVSPANQDAAFLAVSIESLVAPLGLPLYKGYDDLDEMWLTFLTLPSGETVTLMEYLHSPQPGVCICVDAKIQNIPQIVFDSCLQLQVPREEVSWFHPDWQDEIDSLFETLRERLYAEHWAIEKRPESSQAKELLQIIQYEPIDCFNHALRIYQREYVPVTYWAMLQHNLGLAYFNRDRGGRRENLERSIECFNKSLEIFTQNEFPEKWKINQDDLVTSQKSLKQFLVKDIFYRWSKSYLSNAGLRIADLMIGDDLSNADLSGADLSGARLIRANLSGADLSGARLVRAKLLRANLTGANLTGADLSRADIVGVDLTDTDISTAIVVNALFRDNIGISERLKQDLITRGANFYDFSDDRSESRNLVSY